MGEIGDLCDDVLVEILVRLPSKYVLRCRAVCKSWHRITTGHAFLADHAARRPREMILRWLELFWKVSTIELSPVPSQRWTRQLCDRRRCWEENGKLTDNGDSRFDVLYSLDGLLILRQRFGLYTICNPITRQWTNLPVLTGLGRPPCDWAVECGFYFHRSSGEYRLLCHGFDKESEQKGIDNDEHRFNYYIVSTGASSPRRICPAPEYLETFHHYDVPVIHRDHLYWYSQYPGAPRPGLMLAFDTISETFRFLSRPPERDDYLMSKLLDLDGELCVVAIQSCLKYLDVWVLEDYDVPGWRWTLRHRIEVSMSRRWYDIASSVSSSMTKVISIGDGVILIANTWSRVGRLFDIKNKLLLTRDFKFGYGSPTSLIFGESLVQHAFFD